MTKRKENILIIGSIIVLLLSSVSIPLSIGSIVYGHKVVFYSIAIPLQIPGVIYGFIYLSRLFLYNQLTTNN